MISPMQVGDSYSYSRKISFVETDAGGKVHFTNVLRYVEEAEHAFLLENNIQIINDDFALPRVHVECDYRAPIFYADTITVLLEIEKKGNTSTAWKFQVKRGDVLCAEGKMVTVKVSKHQGS